MLWHFPAPQVFTGTPQLRTDHRLFPAPPGGESGKISPEFSATLPVHLGTRGWEGAAASQGAQLQHQERSSRAASTSCEGSSLFPVPSGAAGECYWVEVHATSLVRQSRSSEQPCCSRADLQRAQKPQGRWGWHCTLALGSVLFWANS